MDFSAWNPSHTLIVIFGVLAFAAQVGIYFYRTAQNDKKLEKLGETLCHTIERLEDRMDKRLVEMNQRIGETNQRIDSVRVETTDQIKSVRTELSKLNQNHIDHLTRHHVFVADSDRLSV